MAGVVNRNDIKKEGGEEGGREEREINEFLLGARPFFPVHRIMDANRM